MTNHLPMNTTHEYTDDQIQTAIDRACVAVPACRISLANWTKDWREEKAQRLSIAKTFLAALFDEPTQPSPPMIRLRLPSEKPTREDGDKDGEIGTYGPEGINFCKWDSDISDVHFWLPGSLPDDILPREPTQEETWQAEFEKCFPDFDLTKQDTGGYLHAHAATAWRAFLAAKKGGAK